MPGDSGMPPVRDEGAGALRRLGRPDRNGTPQAGRPPALRLTLLPRRIPCTRVPTVLPCQSCSSRLARIYFTDDAGRRSRTPGNNVPSNWGSIRLAGSGKSRCLIPLGNGLRTSGARNLGVSTLHQARSRPFCRPMAIPWLTGLRPPCLPTDRRRLHHDARKWHRIGGDNETVGDHVHRV